MYDPIICLAVFFYTCSVFAKENSSNLMAKLMLSPISFCSGSKQLCSHDVAYYSLRSTIDGYSELQSSVQKETNYDIFCIQSQNRKSSGTAMSQWHKFGSWYSTKTLKYETKTTP